MEDQELKDKISEAHTEWATGKVGYSILLTDHLLPIIQSYADARVESETKELEDDYAELKMIHDKFYESDALQHKEILALKAEIKQLREVVERTRQYCESGNGRGGATKLPSGEWHNEGEGTLYHAVLGVLSSETIEQTEEEKTTPTDDEIHFVAVDESNAERHGWKSLNQKPAYVDGFEDGAKWMRDKKTT